MKKSIKLFLLFALALIFITGCGWRQDVTISVHPDSTVKYSLVAAYDNDVIDMQMKNAGIISGDEEATDAQRWEYVRSQKDSPDYDQYKGYEAEEWESKEFKGYEFTKEMTLDDLTAKEKSETGFTNLATEHKFFTKEGNVYTLDIVIPSGDDVTSGDVGTQLALLGSMLTIELPVEAKEHNATSISESKKVYARNIVEDKDIKLVFEMPEEKKEEEKKEEPAKEPVKEETKEEPKKEEEKKEEPAKEEPKKEEEKKEEAPKKTTPVSWAKADKWAIDELSKANELGVIPETFEAKDFTAPITRKDFAAVAVKLYEALTNKAAKAAEKNPFTDTKDEYVLKAYALEITKGTSDTEFSPDAQITREQMATMLTRALTTAGIKAEANMAEASLFADDGEMSSWAKDSVYFMSQKGIIKGIGENKFGAKDTSTIEQALMIAERSVLAFEKK